MFGKYFKWIGIVTNLVMTAMGKAADGVLTVPEIVDTVEMGVRQVVPEMSENELARLGAITSPYEYKSFDFQEGDVAFVFPAELIGKLKIQLE